MVESRTAAVLVAVVLVAGCSSTSSRARTTAASTATSAASSAVETLTPSLQTSVLPRVRPDEVAAALEPMNGADPVLVPSSVPSGWTAAVTMAFSAYSVTYTGPAGELVPQWVAEVFGPA